MSEQTVRVVIEKSESDLQRELQDAITAAGTVWDHECKVAYELNLFDMSREAYVAFIVTQWIKGNPLVKSLQEKKNLIEEALYEISEMASQVDYEYGLPLASHVDDYVNLIIKKVED